METKANYVAVGAFVLISLVAIVIAVLWLAGMQYSRQYADYRTYFTGSVTGLGTGTKVRYNGIEVGRVKDIDFDPDDPKRVIATLQIEPNVKIHEDAVASIASEGLTGGTYVEIDGGSKNAPLVTRKPDEPYPIIRSRPSTIQQLVESAPQVVAKLNKISDALVLLLNEDNRRAVGESLHNLRDITAVFQKRSAEIDTTLLNFSQSSEKLNNTLDSLQQTMNSIDETVRTTNNTVKQIGTLAKNTDDFVTGEGLAQFGQLLGDTRRLVVRLRRLTDKLDDQPTQLFFGDRREGYTPP